MLLAKIAEWYKIKKYCEKSTPQRICFLWVKYTNFLYVRIAEKKTKKIKYMLDDFLQWFSYKMKQHIWCKHEWEFVDPSAKGVNCPSYYVCKKCDYISKLK